MGGCRNGAIGSGWQGRISSINTGKLKRQRANLNEAAKFHSMAVASAFYYLADENQESKYFVR